MTVKIDSIKLLMTDRGKWRVTDVCYKFNKSSILKGLSNGKIIQNFTNGIWEKSTFVTAVEIF